MILFENFNTTHQTSPHFERHQHFAMEISNRSCYGLLTLPVEDRCAYIESSSSCLPDVYLINYIHIIFCNLEISTMWGRAFSSLVLLIIIGIYFTIFGVTSDIFFCPALAVLARMMRMSENVAGVTLVAFGNGAPDIFSSLSYLQNNTRRLYADILASALFVVLIVAGIIFYSFPFFAQPYLLLRDALFLLLDVCVIDYIIKKDSAISVGDSVGTLCIYLCYLFVVIFDQFLVRRATRILQLRRNTLKRLSNLDVIRLNDLRAQGVMRGRRLPYMDRRELSVLYSGSIDRIKYTLWQQLLRTLRPYDETEWKSANFLMKGFLILRAPILIMLKMLIPITDQEEEDSGWSRLLNCVQVVLLPSFISYVTLMQYTLFGMPIFFWSTLIGLPLAVLMFVNSETNGTPAFHQYLSILSVAGSVFIVRVCCAEIINVLAVLSIFTGLSSSFFGVTLLSWANSIGDLIANLYLARQGYQNMALAACFGGPLFNSLLAVGSTLLYKTLTDENFEISEFGEGIMGENCTIFLAISLAILLLAALTTDFYFRPSIGVYVITVYLIFFFYNLLGEFTIIHTYGTDHRMDQVIEPVL
ncbi:mitochondrial sodium/calcium exchanger protein-like isoform X1 [Ceratitis capitata]|uniref:mitochondrial sodium/calcium exchanger protein-like isoform X1 n=1 Tax=Ceratitis capitata TaxID=7213 RepID=UPI000A11B0CB|nr:mitochondrial sodium/calcium exchanger protein-like isoform X1 [Ceratitis capitata]